MPWQLILEISQDWSSCWISRVELASPSSLVIHFRSLPLCADSGSASTWGTAGVSVGNAGVSSHTVAARAPSWQWHCLVRRQYVCLVSLSCLTLWDPLDCSPPGSCPWDSPGKNTGVDCHALLQGISRPRNRTQVSRIADRFFTICATREAQQDDQAFANLQDRLVCSGSSKSVSLTTTSLFYFLFKIGL